MTIVAVWVCCGCLCGQSGTIHIIHIFRKRATKYRSLLRKMPYKDKGSYESSPLCTNHLSHVWLIHIRLSHPSYVWLGPMCDSYIWDPKSYIWELESHMYESHMGPSHTYERSLSLICMTWSHEWLIHMRLQFSYVWLGARSRMHGSHIRPMIGTIHLNHQWSESSMYITHLILALTSYLTSSKCEWVWGGYD